MKKEAPKQSVDKEQYWQDNISAQNKSGQTVQEYCEQHNLGVPSFYAWKRKLNKTSQKRARKIATKAQANMKSASIELTLPSGAVLRWPVDAKPEAVAAMVNALSRPQD